MKGQVKRSVDTKPSGRYVQVAVFLDDTWDYPIFSVIPRDNCPSRAARRGRRSCDECEHWGREVEAIDWEQFSLCRFGKVGRGSSGLDAPRNAKSSCRDNRWHTREAVSPCRGESRDPKTEESP